MRHLLGSQNQQGKRRSSEPGCIRASGLLITLDRDHISAPKTRASSNLSSFSAWWGDMTLLGLCGPSRTGWTRTGQMPGRDSTSLFTPLDMVCLVQNEADLAFALLAQCFQTSPELIADVKPRARVWLRHCTSSEIVQRTENMLSFIAYGGGRSCHFVRTTATKWHVTKLCRSFACPIAVSAEKLVGVKQHNDQIGILGEPTHDASRQTCTIN